MGLLGGLPFLMIIVAFVRLFIKILSKEAKAFFIIGIVASLVYLYEKGLWGAESWLIMMVIMPMGILSIESSRNS